MTFFGETEHFSEKNGALRWSVLVGKQKHNVQKPTGNHGGQREQSKAEWISLFCLQISFVLACF